MKEGMGVKALSQRLQQIREYDLAKDYAVTKGSMEMQLLEEQNVDRLLKSANLPPDEDHVDRLLSRVNMPDVSKPDEAAKIIPQMTIEGIGAFPVNSVAHRQIAQHLGIPYKYYKRMLEEDKELLLTNVNTWLSKEPGDKRLIRTLDGNMRAFLSTRYRRIDNWQIVAAVVEAAIRQCNCVVKSADLSDEYMWLKLYSDKLNEEVKPGDVVHAGLVVRNSEVGVGSVQVEPMIVRLVCWNGAVMYNTIRKRHVGGTGYLGDSDVEELLTDETKRQEDAAFMSKVKDVIKGSLEHDVFNMNVDKLKKATERSIDSPVQQVVEEVAQRYTLTEEETKMTLDALSRAGDMTQYGLGNAVTFMSQKANSYGRATELERVGGEIFELADNDWQALIKKAA